MAGNRIGIGQLVASIGLDLTALQTGLLRAERSMQQAGKNMQRIGKTMSMSVTLPLLSIGGAAFKMGNDFESSLSKVIGLVGVARDQVRAWEKDILRLAPTVGKSPKELADAMFFITSAGLRGAEALEVLEMSAKGSAAGLGETKVVADLVTSAMNAYGKENLSAAQATDILVAAVREGKAEAASLAAAMGQVLPIASAMGVEFNEVSAAVAAMTRTGTGAETASMQLKNVLNSLLKPTSQAEEALDKMGTSSANLRKTIREKGVLAALMEIRSLTNVWGEEMMAEIFPNIRALTGVLDLMGSNLKDNVGIFGALEEATGALDKAFEEVSNTGDFKFKQVLSDLKTTATILGESVRDFLLPVFEKMRDALQRVTNWFNGLNDVQKETIIKVAAVAAAIGPAVFVVGKLVSGVGAAIKAFRVLATVLATNPILLAAGAVTAAAVAIVKFTNKVSAAREEMASLSSVVKQNVAEEKVELQLLLRVAEDENTALKDRKKAIDELNRILPDYLGNIDEEKIRTGEAKEMVDKYIQSLEMKARLQAAEERLVELEKERIKALEEGDNKKVKFLQTAWNAIKTSGNYFRFLEAQQETAARNTAKALEDNEKRRQALLEVIDETSTAVQNIADAEQEIADALADAEKKRQKTDEILAQAEAAERQAEAYKKMLETMESMKKLFAEMAKNAPKFRSETSIGTPETKDVSPFKGFDFTTWAGVDTSELAPMEVPEVLIETTDYWKKLGETITETTTLTSIFSDAILGIGDAFEGIFNKTKGGFKDMVTSILEGLNQVITGLLAEAIAATITGSMKTAKNPIVGLALAAVGTGLLLALWKSKVPEFASGGLVYGDTLARVGEYPGAKQNPEVIAPLSKLQGLLQNRAETHVFVHGEFDGRVLRLVQDYSETIERRSR